MANKRKSNQESLGEVIDRMLNVYRLKSGLTEMDLLEKWPEIVGPVIATRTEKLKLRGKKLIIGVESAAMKQELHYQREQIMSNVNEHFGSTIVTEVVID